MLMASSRKRSGEILCASSLNVFLTVLFLILGCAV
jgi:hypothetical protein